jgi:hypothetical protein
MEVVLEDGSICTDTDIIIYFKYIENFLWKSFELWWSCCSKLEW